ncbi:hypothetical protein [Ectobacillus ponti]|uniref:Uncharacterized protein n=1 Tax=Ectobacillus ponti TaxID=2961894 RepID=A0AA41X7S5_9BACI|nr:hypothetical protein [Ectobacillus ponti]MCP8967853.1 hypothetical protein [Ectobacillus ponti]
MQKSWYLNITFFCFLFLQAFIVITIAEGILPPKYFYDANTIRDQFALAQQFPFSFSTDSFINTAKFYQLLGFDKLGIRVLEGYGSYVLVYVCLIVILVKAKAHLSMKAITIVVVWNVLFGIYLGQLSKDVIAFITITLLLLIILLERKASVVAYIGLFILYALLFRTYWFIYLYFILLNYIIIFNSYNTKIFSRKFSKLFFYAAAIIVLFFAADFVGVHLTDSRSEVNMYRLDSSDAVTILINPFDNSSFLTDALNWIIVWFLCFFPIMLFKNMNLLVLCFVGWNLYNTHLIAKIIKSGFVSSRPLKLIVSMIISFSATQALFEPDLGSLLRHELAVIPLFIFLFLKFTAQFEKRKEMDKEYHGA